MAKTTLKLFPNHLKICKKSNKTPIYARIYHNGIKADKCTDQFLQQNELLLWNQQLGRINSTNHKVNKFLNKISDKFDDFLLGNYFEKQKYSAQQIRDIVFNKEVKSEVPALQYIRNYLSDYITESLDLTKGTKKNYAIAYMHFKNFCEINNLTNLPISKFDTLAANSFHIYLLNSYEQTQKRAMLKVTATGRIKQLRTIFNKAIDESLIVVNPFKSIKNTNKSKLRQKLNLDQIRSIYNDDLSSFPVLNIYRDLFKFSILTGLSYSDTISLNKENICIKNQGIFLSMTRKKTGQLTEMFLPKEAVSLLEKYSDNKECKLKGTLLPTRSNQKLNFHLKLIAAKSEITTNLFFHLARHTFRGIIKEAGIIEPLERKLLMGHSTLSDIDSVYHTVTSEHLLEAKRKIDKFIEEKIQPKLCE